MDNIPTGGFIEIIPAGGYAGEIFDWRYDQQRSNFRLPTRILENNYLYQTGEIYAK